MFRQDLKATNAEPVMIKGTAERGGRPGICVCVCADKHNINDQIHSSDNVKIRYLEKIRLCPTKHPAPALPNSDERKGHFKRKDIINFKS